MPCAKIRAKVSIKLLCKFISGANQFAFYNIASKAYIHVLFKQPVRCSCRFPFLSEHLIDAFGIVDRFTYKYRKIQSSNQISNIKSSCFFN